MSGTLLTSGIFGFDDANAGHVCAMGSAPPVGAWDILCINSDTILSVAGFGVALEQAINNQGAYIFGRQAVGGEGSSFTVTSSGNHPVAVGWSRWNGLIALDTSTSTQANASVAGTTPAHSTGAMADDDELVIAFGAIHSIGTGNQNTPVWTPGTFTQLTASHFQGIGSNGVRGFVGYKNGAGPTAEAPNVSWSGDGAFDRYMLTVSFTTVSADAGAGSRFMSFF